MGKPRTAVVAMRARCCALMTILASLWAVPAMADLAPAGGAPHLAMQLVPESDSPRAGQALTIAIATQPEKGWHGYWRNPGDAGFAPALQWTLPKGVTAAPDLQWPVPSTLVVAGLMNYVYEAPYAPLATLRVPAGLAKGTKLPVRSTISSAPTRSACPRRRR